MIWTMGELLVEIMRPRADMPLDVAGEFLGPFPSGAPAIFIDAAARAGQKCGIIGGVGKDDFGTCLINRLEQDGVDCSRVLVDDSGSTGCAFVAYSGDGARKFIFHMGNTPAAKAKRPEEIPQADFFHIMGCSLMSSTEFGREIVETMHAFCKGGAKISFDPNVRPELLGDSSLIDEVLDNTAVFLPGKEEILRTTGCRSVAEAVAKLFQNPVLEIIVVKDGVRGCKVYTGKDSFEVGVYDMVAVDATGAGDCFDGVFIAGFALGLPIKECAQRASAAAALNVAAFGPMEGKISPENIDKVIERKAVRHVCTEL